jgi:hypothetical protein
MLEQHSSNFPGLSGIDYLKENCWTLLAMDRYFNTYEKQTPEFVARVWLGDNFVGKAEFMGRSVDTQEVNVPMKYLLENEGMLQK